MGACFSRRRGGRPASSSNVRSGQGSGATLRTETSGAPGGGAPSMATADSAGTGYATPNSRTTGARAATGSAAEHPPSAANSDRSAPAAASPTAVSPRSALDSSLDEASSAAPRSAPRSPAASSDDAFGAGQTRTPERHGTNRELDNDATATSAPAAPTAPPAEPLAEVLAAAEGRCNEMQVQLEQATQQAVRADQERQDALAHAQQARAALEQAGAAWENAVREVNDLLTLGIIDQPNPNLFRGPVRFGAAAHARLLTTVLATAGGTGQRLGPGWAFKTDAGRKLHKAKCGHQESFNWYHYSTRTGRDNTGLALCDKPHCQWAFAHEEAYLVD